MWGLGPSCKWAGSIRAPITAKPSSILLQWETGVQRSLDQTARYRQVSISSDFGGCTVRKAFCASWYEISEKRIAQGSVKQMGGSSRIPPGALWMPGWNPSRWCRARNWWWRRFATCRWEWKHAHHSHQKSWRYSSQVCTNSREGHQAEGGTLSATKHNVWSLEANDHTSAWDQVQLPTLLAGVVLWLLHDEDSQRLHPSLLHCVP